MILSVINQALPHYMSMNHKYRLPEANPVVIFVGTLFQLKRPLTGSDDVATAQYTNHLISALSGISSVEFIITSNTLADFRAAQNHLLRLEFIQASLISQGISVITWNLLKHGFLR